jgi:flagellar motor switch protein FliG
MENRIFMEGKKKAAIFLMVMGENFTAQVFRHLDDREIKLLGEEMASIKKIDSRTISAVMDEFSKEMGDGSMGLSGKDFLQKTMPKAFDTKKADELLGDLLSKGNEKSFEKLSNYNPTVLANLLMTEHPQTIALILVNMKHQTAAEIIKALPEHLQGEVIIRIADLDEVPSEIIEEIHEVVDEMISDMGNETHATQGGIEAAAEILNNLDNQTENNIFDKIESVREELADEIRQKMFVSCQP